MNTHKINDDESDISVLETTTTSHASSISSINSSITTINNKLSGSSTSGLKSLITGNDTDISNIETKTDYITVTGNINLDTVLSNTNTNNAKITYPSSASTKLALIGISSSVNLNSLVTQSNVNVTDITALENAFPRNTIIRHYNYTTGDIYNDGTIKLNWDGTNKQLRFWVLSIGTSEYMVGGVKIWKGTTEIRKSIYVSQNVSTAYKYFTDPQTGASQSIVDNTYDLKTSYGTAEYFLTPYLEENYPSYEIKILIGYHLGWHTIHIKRFT